MKYITNILILFLSVNGYAQIPEKIELLHAEKLTSGPKNSDYWICTGNVSFSHNNTIMSCDYSHHYTKENKMIAYNNVSIKKGDTLNVKGKQGTHTHTNVFVVWKFVYKRSNSQKQPADENAF